MDQKSVRLPLPKNEMSSISGGSESLAPVGGLICKIAYYLGYAGGYGVEMYNSYYPIILK